jgi:hypothetical protein
MMAVFYLRRISCTTSVVSEAICRDQRTKVFKFCIMNPAAEWLVRGDLE